ncbi:hypothetical protein J7L67_02125, partial [bacterium]|nr:hypothetical protein [bacterium]
LDTDDKILIYEIQSQFYLKGFCISADSIVGNQFLNALTGKETFSDFIKRENVKYIVTYTSFNYRPIYNDTIFEKLYTMDLKLNVGETFINHGIKYKKIMTNPNFSDTDKYSVQYWGRQLNDGTCKIRKSKNFSGWDSVFKIIL